MKRYPWLSVFAAGLMLAVWVIAVNAQRPVDAGMRESSPTSGEPGPAATGGQVVAPLDTATFYAAADAYVDSATPTQNYGGATTLYVGTQSTGALERALFRFELSALPPSAIIDDANLRVYLNQSPSGPPLVVDISAYRITASWIETSTAWANQPSALSIGEVTGVSTTVQYYEWEVTGLVQDWLASPATNFGVELRSTSEGTMVGWRGFASREASAASRPQLVVEYHLPACTDAQEPNDTFAQAFLITPTVEYTGCIPTPSDLDYFRFDVASNTAISVELFSLPANYDLYLYDPAQALLDSSINAGTTSEMVEYTTGPAGGQFYAKVQSGGESDLYNPYALKLTLTPVTVWPDLVINDVWREGNQVCYEIENLGQATALQGHHTSLHIGSMLVVTDSIEVDLAPGATIQRCFVYQWQCTLPQDTLTVCADHGNDVSESNETNNCTEEIWICDTSPPVIVTGPTVSDITSASATVSWTTDEDSDSAVQFGRKAGTFEGEETDSALTQAHVVVLTGLEPSATYRYVVRSTDAASNTVTSRELFFKTGPATSSPPSISEVTLTRMPGKLIYYNIAASVPISGNVERMEFYMDGELLGKAYSPKPGAPGLYEFPLIPAALNILPKVFFADHIIEAVSVGSSGPPGRFSVPFQPPYECIDLHVDVERPYEDEIFYTDGNQLPSDTILYIDVYAYQRDPDCIDVDFNAPDCRWPQDLDRVEFRVNGEPKCTIDDESPNRPDHYICPWDASGLGLGDYQIRVDAILTETCKQTVDRYVTVAQGEPSLEVSREVTRHGNYFEVTLTVENHGDAAYDVNRIEDHVAGFQPITKSADLAAGQHYEVTSDCETTGESCDVTLDVSDGGLAAIRLERGDSLTLNYLAVPILLPDTVLWHAPDYAIGGEPLHIVGLHEANNPTFDRPCIVTTNEALLSNAVISATAESDYLIVTRPERLFGLYNAADTNALLVEMAELAQRKNGILGYLVGLLNAFFFNVDDTILEWGAGMRGSDGEPGHWLSNGYLLIVGEANIVPPYIVPDADIFAATLHWSTAVPVVRLVDNSYADTDDNLSPELIVGRIIGNDIASMRLPLEMARLDAFDCSRALTVSGLDTDTVNLDSFVTSANDIAEAYTERFTEVDVEHWSEYDTVTDALDSFVIAAQAQDVIIYSDHGNRWSWSSVLDTGDALDFFGTHPIVAAFACSTGYYDRINSIADKFLDNEAGGYIGSTELSAIATNCEAGLMFANRWPAEGISAGKALRNTKRALLAGDQSHYERLWVMEYNLYGDPKYGVWPIPEMAVAESDALSALLSPTSLEVIVPDYQVTPSASGNLDTARIPGGLMLLEPGLPMVPIYVVTQPYPKGHRVQDVVLVTRSGLVTTTGLTLPLVSDDPASAVVVSGSSESAESGTGWYPEKDFVWEVEEEADGTTMLIIRMYPFYYDMATTDVQFYKNYSFDIDVITSTVEIATVTTDKRMYPQGEPVSVGMVISGTNDTEDVIVEAVIRHYSSGTLVEGLPLHSLAGMQGLATFSTQWDSVEPGLYNAEVTLRSANGDVLHRQVAQFAVGIAVGEITTFTVTPTLFDIGAQVAVSLTFANTGTVPLTGTAVVQIQTEAGEVIQDFGHDYGDLAPGNSISFADAWDTTGAASGSYRVIAYVLYESTATEPRAAIVRTRRSLYLPLVLRQSETQDRNVQP